MWDGMTGRAGKEWDRVINKKSGVFVIVLYMLHCIGT
jgi:hypothetical protein